MSIATLTKCNDKRFAVKNPGISCLELIFKSTCSQLNDLNPVQSSRLKFTTCPCEQGVCSDSNQTAQQLQMAVHKSLETMSGMILAANEKQNLKAM